MASFNIEAPVESLRSSALEEIGTDEAEDVLLDLFQQMRVPVLRHLRLLNLNRDEAEDIMQETFLRLYQHLRKETFSRRNLRGWIWTVAHNQGVNLRLKNTRAQNGAQVDLEEVTPWLADSGPNPEQVLEARQRSERIEGHFRELTSRDKQCVNLRVQRLGYRQIASVLGIGRSTVGDTLSRVTSFLQSNSPS